MANTTKAMIAEPIPWNVTSDSHFLQPGWQVSSKDGNGTC